MENYYDTIKNGIEEAMEDDTPYIARKGKNIAIIGDANKTEVRKYDIDLTFTTEEGRFTKEYRNLFVKPKQQLKFVQLLVELMPYFRKPEDDGTIGEYTVYEIAEIMANMDDVIFDKMYDLVMMACGVPAELRDYIEPASVIVATATFLSENKNVVNEAEQSFEKSSDS